MSSAHLHHFWKMGGYGLYVWSAYGVCAAGIIWNILQTRRLRRQALNRLSRQLSLESTS
jgi:heme exporter protein D